MEMRFLCKTAGLSFCGRVRIALIIQDNPLLLRFERSQVRLFGHLKTMLPGWSPVELYQEHPTGPAGEILPQFCQNIQIEKSNNSRLYKMLHVFCALMISHHARESGKFKVKKAFIFGVTANNFPKRLM